MLPRKVSDAEQAEEHVFERDPRAVVDRRQIMREVLAERGIGERQQGQQLADGRVERRVLARS